MASLPHGPSPAVRLWPWSAAAAVAAVPVALVVLLVGLGILRASTGWPAERYQGWALLAVAILALLPVLLLLMDTVVRNRGEVRVLGVSLSFAAASQEAATRVRSATLDENLGTDVAEPIGQTSLPVVIRALRRAHDTDVTVVDLSSGHTWWESRLFILVAGAAARGKPQAIAFVGRRNGVDGSFLGWAPPSRLLDLHLAAEPLLAEPYAGAVAAARRWELGTPVAGNPQAAQMPWPGPPTYLPANPDEPADPRFALELFLNANLRQHPLYQRFVTLRRLQELYESDLVLDQVEIGSPDEAWLALLRQGHNRFFALTAQGRLRTLVPRDALLAALVLRLAEAGARPGDSQRGR